MSKELTIYVLYEPEYGYLDIQGKWTWDIRKIWAFDILSKAHDAFDIYSKKLPEVVIRTFKITDRP